MADTSTSRKWTMRGGYLLLAVVVVFAQLVPLQTTPRGWAAPDLILCITLAWALRRPDYVPALAIAAAMVFADFMLHRPPGLMALLAVISAEYLKSQIVDVHNEGFLTELVLAALAILFVMIGARIILALLVLPRPPLGLLAQQAALTIIVYPAVVAVSTLIFRVRVRTANEAATGSRSL